MNAIAWNEVVSRRLLLVAALLAGWVPVVKPFEHPESLLGISGTIAIVFAIVSGLAVGGGLLGRDLVERRLSFWFNQPISGWAIFLGKFLGGAAVVVAATLLVELPGLVVRFGSVRASEIGLVAGLLVSVAVAAIAVGIVLGVQVRVLSAWTLVDLVLCAVLVWVVLQANGLVSAAISKNFDALFRAMQIEAGFALLAVVALLASGAAAVVVGRTDPAQVRRALSVTLLATLTPLAIGFWIWAHVFSA